MWPRPDARSVVLMDHRLDLHPWQAVRQPPADGTDEEKIDFALRCAILAPSSHNTQPWRFRVEDSRIELFADRSRALPVVDPQHRELVLSCGAALFHLRVALRALGRHVRVERIPAGTDLDLLARLELGGEAEPSERELELLEAVAGRRTNRRPFDGRTIPHRLTEELRTAAAEEGASLVVVTDDERKSRLADLVAESDRRQWDDRRFRAELAAWSRPNRSRRGDGLPGYGVGQADAASVVGPLVVRAFDLGRRQAAHDRELAVGSPALAVLFTHWDAPAHWLAAGEALAHLLLRAQAGGVYGSFLNQPIEDLGARPRVRELLHQRGFPQVLVRLGYASDTSPHTPRRTLQDVLL